MLNSFDTGALLTTLHCSVSAGKHVGGPARGPDPGRGVGVVGGKEGGVVQAAFHQVRLQLFHNTNPTAARVRMGEEKKIKIKSHPKRRLDARKANAGNK